MVFVEYLGIAAGALIAGSMIPQLTRIFKLKSAHEISLLFTSLFFIGAICWMVYGIILSLFAVILWNAVMVMLIALLFYAKLKYGR